ncbi:hypothetical protein [Candidatus Chlamydia corallus]|uniref:hypothetical protein n=1 Tax=Candidatus Chlamydia corallus TaxID=2038470 RepID=UPI000C2FB108|nr:hypothetical protein [Candidatus Chlamydia corallus]
MIEFAFLPHTSAITTERVEDRIASRMNKLSILAIASLFVLIISVLAMIAILSISGIFEGYAFIIGIVFLVLSLIACVSLLYFFYSSSQELKYSSSQEFRFLPKTAIVSTLSSYKYLSQDAIDDILQDKMIFPIFSSLLHPDAFFLEFPYFSSWIANHSMNREDRLSREAFFILLGEITWKDCVEKIFPWLKDPNMTPESFLMLLESHFNLKNLEKKIITWIRKAYPEISLPKRSSWSRYIYRSCSQFLLPAEHDLHYQRLLNTISYFSGELPAMILGLGQKSLQACGFPATPKDLTWNMFMENMPALLQNRRHGPNWKISLEDVVSL